MGRARSCPLRRSSSLSGASWFKLRNVARSKSASTVYVTSEPETTAPVPPMPAPPAPSVEDWQDLNVDFVRHDRPARLSRR